MEDFSGLAARVAATVGELRCCLILSRDGLVLGAFPDGDERQIKSAWLRFAALGEPEKGFVQFGEEIWVYIRRGPYAAFAVTGPGVRPGLVMDQLEQVLLTAEESRSKRDTLKVPETPAAPSGKPRTSLHPEARPTTPEPQPVVVHAEPAAAQASATPAPSVAAPATAPAAPTPSSEPVAEPTEDEGEGEGEVDRVMLAQEFSRLLQDGDFRTEE